MFPLPAGVNGRTRGVSRSQTGGRIDPSFSHVQAVSRWLPACCLGEEGKATCTPRSPQHTSTSSPSQRMKHDARLPFSLYARISRFTLSTVLRCRLPRYAECSREVSSHWRHTPLQGSKTIKAASAPLQSSQHPGPSLSAKRHSGPGMGLIGWRRGAVHPPHRVACCDWQES